jgi:membrane protease YdiL (CAAX protease family)
MLPDGVLFSNNVVSTLRKRATTFPFFAIVLPTVGVVASEIFLFYGHTAFALWGHFLTLLVCAFVPLSRSADTDPLQMFALLPLFRLVNLGMPVFVELTLLWFPLVYAPVLPAVYLVIRTRPHLGPRFNGRAFGLLLVPALIGSAFLGEVEWLIITPEALVTEWSLTQLLLIAVVMIGFIGFTEELLFRGVLQTGLKAYFGQWGSILFVSALFGLMHSGYGSGLQLLFAGCLGLLYGVTYEYTDSLLLVTVMHGVLNVFLFAVVPIHGPFVL